MFARVLVAALASSCFALAAAADGFYLALDVGPSFFSDSELEAGGDSADLTYDTGFHVGGAAGYRFLEHFRGELAMNYRQADTDELEDGGSINASGDVGVFATLANAYADIDLGVPVKPYVGAGIGIGVVFVDTLNVDDDSTEFAWNVMAGVSYAVTENWILSGGYRYLSTTDPTIEGVDAEIGMHELVFGGRYEF